jgi:hypothetical protein
MEHGIAQLYPCFFFFLNFFVIFIYPSNYFESSQSYYRDKQLHNIARDEGQFANLHI